MRSNFYAFIYVPMLLCGKKKIKNKSALHSFHIALSCLIDVFNF